PEVIDATRGFAVFVRAVRTLARQRPLLVVLDDLSADADTAALVELLLFEQTVDPFEALVMIPIRPTRPEDALHRTLLRTRDAEDESRCLLTLDPLPLEPLAHAIERELGLAPRAAEQIARRSGGNPLFARHLARASSGTFEQDVTQVVASSHETLPDALRDILGAGVREQLSRTPDPQRSAQLLEWAAVIGDAV